MKTIQEITNRAKEIATDLTTHYPSSFLTVGFAKSLNVTVNGPTTFGRTNISIPVNIFHFDSFRDYNKRVILNRDTLKVQRVIALGK